MALCKNILSSSMQPFWITMHLNMWNKGDLKSGFERVMNWLMIKKCFLLVLVRFANHLVLSDDQYCDQRPLNRRRILVGSHSLYLGWIYSNLHIERINQWHYFCCHISSDTKKRYKINTAAYIFKYHSDLTWLKHTYDTFTYGTTLAYRNNSKLCAI